MELKEIAAISGKGGLFKILKPSRTGVIVETLDKVKKKMAINANSKVSILKEISIYVTDKEGSLPLEEVLFAMFEKYNTNLPIESKADGADLFAFLKEVVPNYDEEKVYASDIKKLVSWYNILTVECPEVLERKAEEAKEEEKKEEKAETEESKEEKPKKKPAAKKTTKAKTETSKTKATKASAEKKPVAKKATTKKTTTKKSGDK